jgi:hypothetical protein
MMFINEKKLMTNSAPNSQKRRQQTGRGRGMGSFSNNTQHIRYMSHFSKKRKKKTKKKGATRPYITTTM